MWLFKKKQVVPSHRKAGYNAGVAIHQSACEESLRMKLLLRNYYDGNIAHLVNVIASVLMAHVDRCAMKMFSINDRNLFVNGILDALRDKYLESCDNERDGEECANLIMAICDGLGPCNSVGEIISFGCEMILSEYIDSSEQRETIRDQAATNLAIATTVMYKKDGLSFLVSTDLATATE